MKTGSTTIPRSKADINAGTIPLMILKELEAVYGFNTEELVKGKVKAIPDEVFSPDDRKAKLRTIRDNLKNISLQGDLIMILGNFFRQDWKLDFFSMCKKRGRNLIHVKVKTDSYTNVRLRTSPFQ